MAKNIHIGFTFTVDERADFINSIEVFDKETIEFYFKTRNYLKNLNVNFDDVQFSQVTKRVTPPPPPIRIEKS